MPSCPGCGGSIDTPKTGRHIFGCGYEGDHDDPKPAKEWKGRWSRGEQLEILAETLDAVGLDRNRARDLLRELWHDARTKGRPKD